MKPLKYSCLLFGILVLYQLPAQIPFTEVTDLAGLDHHFLSPDFMGGGAAFFDYDNDGDEDIWISGGLNQDVLYKNNGAGTFSEVGNQAGLGLTNDMISSGVITGDLDNDGFKDVLVLPHSATHPLLFKNQGDGTFIELSTEAGLSGLEFSSYAAAFGDINKDGYLDIYITTYISENELIYDGNGQVIGFDHDCFDNLLFINDGGDDLSFSEQAESYGVKNTGCSLATTFTDFDRDADPDLIIANDYGAWLSPNALYENNFPNLDFSDISQNSGMDVGIFGMGIAIGDYDQDADLDYYITNLGSNVFMENQGEANFIDKSEATGTIDTYVNSLFSVGWGTAFIDVDNDTDLDLFVCNGHVPAAPFINNNPLNNNRLFINDGNPDGTGFAFLDQAVESGLADDGRGRGFSYCDYDNDGDLDILIVNVNQNSSGNPVQKVKLFRNDQNNGNHWLNVKLKGEESNRDAIGASIRIVVDGQTWVHDYNGGFGSHAAHHSSIAHFGLGVSEMVDSMIVLWPGGSSHVFTDLNVDRLICILENGTITNTQDELRPVEFMDMSIFPNPFSDQTTIQFYMDKTKSLSFEVIDMLGRKVISLERKIYTEGEHVIPLNFNYRQAAQYILIIKSDHSLFTHKLSQFK